MNKEVFILNRKKISENMPSNSILILFASAHTGHESFRVNKNFYYATGCDEADDIFLLYKNDSSATSYLFIKEYDELFAKWNGKSYSEAEAYEISGVDKVIHLPKFDMVLNTLLNTVNLVYLDFNRTNISQPMTETEEFSKKLREKYPWLNFANAKDIMKKCRMVKQQAEIDEIKKACDITNEGIKNILKNLKPGMYEYQVESFFDQAIKYHKAKRHAFTTICASGVNACCLHYSSNNQVCNDGDLILVDLGAANGEYHSDISRTFPINGRFTNRQKGLYNIVLNGQLECIKFIKVGVTTKEVNEYLTKYYQKALKEIGLIKEDKEVSKYYYHGVSHHLGLDTHDLSETSPLQEGCVITCEPGLYIEEEKIGIRIEDDILVTANGAVNLSSNILKTVEEIEEFMKNNK